MKKEFKLKKEANEAIKQLKGWPNACVVSILADVSSKRKIRYLIRLEGDDEYGVYLEE